MSKNTAKGTAKNATSKSAGKSAATGKTVKPSPIVNRRPPVKKSPAVPPKLDYKPGAPLVAGVKNVRKFSDTDYTDGAVMSMPGYTAGAGGRDCWGNVDGCAADNRAIIALSAGRKSGDALPSPADVGELSVAIQHVLWGKPLSEVRPSVASPLFTRPDGSLKSAALSSHVNTLKSRLLLIPTDGYQTWQAPGRGVVAVSPAGESMARKLGQWTPITSAEKTALQQWRKIVAAAQSKLKSK